MTIQEKKIFLRAILPSDADLLYNWENNKDHWNVSGTKKPFTKKEIQDFISNQKDIYLDKQLRLMICTSHTLPGKGELKKEVGCIDLFDFDGANFKAWIGILIDEKYREKGHASEALELLIKYSFETLRLQSLCCHIEYGNKASMKLFQKHKFIITDKKKDLFSLELVNNRS